MLITHFHIEMCLSWGEIESCIPRWFVIAWVLIWAKSRTLLHHSFSLLSAVVNHYCLWFEIQFFSLSPRGKNVVAFCVITVWMTWALSGIIRDFSGEHAVSLSLSQPSRNLVWGTVHLEHCSFLCFCFPEYSSQAAPNRKLKVCLAWQW